MENVRARLSSLLNRLGLLLGTMTSIGSFVRHGLLTVHLTLRVQLVCVVLVLITTVVTLLGLLSELQP